MKKKLLLPFSIVFALSACVSSSYKVAENISELNLSFTDSKWNGQNIPSGQQCRRFGGVNPETPELKVSNIPSEANALVVEYSDKSHPRMNNGGHGKIGYNIDPGSREVIVPSVPGHSFDLPKGFYLVSAQINPQWDDAGAYLPPCSGGKGNTYYATVRAIVKGKSTEEKSLRLAEGVIDMGRY